MHAASNSPHLWAVLGRMLGVCDGSVHRSVRHSLRCLSRPTFADGNCLNRTTFAALFVFADSGEYELHTCEQLGAVRPGVKARAHDLKLLMDKGRAEHGRQFVNAIAGKSD
jgi:hypothetical protein